MLRCPPVSKHPDSRLRFLAVTLLLALTAAVFHAVCGQAFVDWDDYLHTYQNPLLQPVNAAHLRAFWQKPYDGQYIPVSYMVFAGLSLIAPLSQPVPSPSGGWTVLNPHVFHTANLVLHLLNVLLVFALLRRIVRRDWAAFGGALLFAVHPLQVEAVAWISELRGLLSGFFALLALWQYLHYAQAAAKPHARWHYVVALAAFALALLAKPSAVTLPLLAWILDWGVARRPWRTATISALGWLLLAVPIVWLTRGAQPVPTDLFLPLWQRPFVAGDALAFYLSKLLLPVRLGTDYGRTPAFVLGHAWVWATWLAPVTVLGLAWRFRARSPLLLPVAGLFVAALLPVLGFVPFLFQTYSTVADRYLYLAMLAPALLLAWWLAQSHGRVRPLLTGGLLTVCIGLSLAQVRVWDDSLTLFGHALSVNPRSAVMHYDLGNALRSAGRTDEAIAQYRASLRIKPDAPNVHCNLGQALADRGQSRAALGEFQEAVRLKPDLVIARLSLGQQFADLGRTDAAIDQWEAAVRLQPDFRDLRYNLGCALWQRRRVAEAAAQFSAALRLDPSFAPARQALERLAPSARRGYNRPPATQESRSPAVAAPASSRPRPG